jgi:hypothetical protein
LNRAKLRVIADLRKLRTGAVDDIDQAFTIASFVSNTIYGDAHEFGSFSEKAAYIVIESHSAPGEITSNPGSVNGAIPALQYLLLVR